VCFKLSIPKLSKLWFSIWLLVPNYVFNFSESVKATRVDEKAVTDEKINELIGKWFRQTPDRKGGSGLRKKKPPNGDTEEDKEEEDRTRGARVLSPNTSVDGGLQ